MKLRAADLFAGGGGTSTGLTQACASRGIGLDLVAVNHWNVAVETHSQNHPTAKHLCADLDAVRPGDAVPGGKLDLLVASPECTQHSRARGGKPVSDQKRASAWCVVRWAEALQPRAILVENVREFADWGPTGATSGRPLKSRKGELFRAWLSAIEALGYQTDHHILNAADYGDATTRERLFVVAWRGRTPFRWPAPSHTREPVPTLFDAPLPRWRAAREVIDWTLKGKSIFGRKKPLSDNTLKRIEAGLRKFGGKAAEPFLVLLRGTDAGQVAASARCIDGPVPTLCAQAEHAGLVQPFALHVTHHGGDRVHDLDGPLPTVTGANRGELAFILPHRQFTEMQTDSLDAPLRTITGTNGGCNGLVEPFVVQYHGASTADGVASPLHTVTAKDRFGLVQPVRLDILFRMLAPHELAAAMSFPADYRFAGKREFVVRQVGNAVPVGLARALCLSLLDLIHGRAA